MEKKGVVRRRACKREWGEMRIIRFTRRERDLLEQVAAEREVMMSTALKLGVWELTEMKGQLKGKHLPDALVSIIRHRDQGPRVVPTAVCLGPRTSKAINCLRRTLKHDRLPVARNIGEVLGLGIEYYAKSRLRRRLPAGTAPK